MRLAALVLSLTLAAPAWAQTEADLLRWVEENKPKADAGQISLLDFYRDMHTRIAIIPGETYPHKAVNLRWIGRKVDILEAVEAGSLTPDQGRRRLAEADAEMEEAENRQRTAKARADFDRAEAQRAQQEQAAAQADAQRRAILLQMIQNNQARQPYQAKPYQIPIPQETRCSSQWIGNRWQTVCR